MSTQPEMSLNVPVPPRRLVPGEGREDLARGLLLMRASSMSMVRFQLAIERRDRAVALETVDELVAIDRRLGDFLQDMPAPGGRFADLVGEVERQRASLVREKLTLGAGRSGPAADGVQPAWAEPAPPVPAIEEPLELGEAERLRTGLPIIGWILFAGVVIVLTLAAVIFWEIGLGEGIAAR